MTESKMTTGPEALGYSGILIWHQDIIFTNGRNICLSPKYLCYLFVQASLATPRMKVYILNKHKVFFES